MDESLTPTIDTPPVPVAGPPAPAPGPAAPVGTPPSCPLCDYGLRGLVEPRCPECGYRFEWPDLIDPERKRHPYLFEHHPRRNVRSFVRTMLGGLRPGRFWTSLRPSQPSRPRRLLLYWLLATLLLPAGYAGAVGWRAARYVKEHNALRASQYAMIVPFYARYSNGPIRGGTLGEIAAAGGPRAWVDKTFPPPGTARYVRYVFRMFFQHRVGQDLDAFVILFAWPWLTLATLMIFRASMRRAKVQPVHVMRCALYSGDGTLWLGLLAMFLVPPVVHDLDLGRHIGFRDAAVAAPMFALFVGWRLAAAYRHYLRFDRPALTATAAQAIVLLVVWLGLVVRAWEAT